MIYVESAWGKANHARPNGKKPAVSYIWGHDSYWLGEGQYECIRITNEQNGWTRIEKGLMGWEHWQFTSQELLFYGPLKREAI